MSEFKYLSLRFFVNTCPGNSKFGTELVGRGSQMTRLIPRIASGCIYTFLPFYGKFCHFSTPTHGDFKSQ